MELGAPPAQERSRGRDEHENMACTTNRSYRKEKSYTCMPPSEIKASESDGKSQGGYATDQKYPGAPAIKRAGPALTGTGPSAHKSHASSQYEVDGAGGEHRSALIWTLPAQRAEYLQACEDAEFLMALQQRFGSRLGAITHVGERFCYPLKLVEAKEQVRSNIVIMGNAAHSLHPVAGQGFNLALRDVAHLSACLSAAQKQGHAIGDLEVLLNYEQQQKLDQKMTIGFSDKITELFANQNPLVSLARNMGLLAMDLVPELKDSFVSHAAGQAGLADWPYKELTQ